MNTDDASRQRAADSERELKAGVDARAGESRPTLAEGGQIPPEATLVSSLAIDDSAVARAAMAEALLNTVLQNMETNPDLARILALPQGGQQVATVAAVEGERPLAQSQFCLFI